jgi:hypothetical protein
MLGKNPNQYYMICGILHFERFFRHKTGTESRALPRMFGSHQGTFVTYAFFQKFRKVKPNRLATTCPRYKEAFSMLLSSDEKN